MTDPATPPTDRLPIDLPKEWWLAAGVVIQVVVAILMYWSIRHSESQFELASKQFEATIEPVVSISGYQQVLTIENRGTIPISKIELAGLLHASFSRSNMTPYMVRSEVYGNPYSICDSTLISGAKTNCSIPSMLMYSFGQQEWIDARKSQSEYLGVVICYRRSVDMKAFYKLTLFELLPLDNTPTSTFILFERDPSHSIIVGGGLGETADLAVGIRTIMETKLDESHLRYK